jgi:hypothetical protein
MVKQNNIMLLSQQLKNRLRMLLFITFLNSASALANDSLYIKFINKKIEIETNGVISFTLRDKCFIFQKINDTLIECFILKKNKMYCYGSLKIVQTKHTKTALRENDWYFGNTGDYSNKKYYHNDEMLSLKYKGKVLKKHLKLSNGRISYD